MAQNQANGGPPESETPPETTNETENASFANFMKGSATLKSPTPMDQASIPKTTQSMSSNWSGPASTDAGSKKRINLKSFNN